MAAAKKKTASRKKRTMPTPKSTKNMPPGLAAYWKKRGVAG
jgi:hypothetical protein